VLDHQGAAGILPKPSDERKRDEAFPTIKISEPNEAIPSLRQDTHPLVANETPIVDVVLMQALLKNRPGARPY
jgi:hypothetical protein